MHSAQPLNVSPSFAHRIAGPDCHDAVAIDQVVASAGGGNKQRYGRRIPPFSSHFPALFACIRYLAARLIGAQRGFMTSHGS
jgi:hypothetical protein